MAEGGPHRTHVELVEKQNEKISLEKVIEIHSSLLGCVSVRLLLVIRDAERWEEGGGIDEC